MDSLSKRLSSYRPKSKSGESTAGRRNRRNSFGPEQLTIVPVPRDELPDEMRSVLESVRADRRPSNLRLIDTLIIFVRQFISSQRPSLADVRLPPPDAQHASTSARSQSQGSLTKGHDGYDYDSRNDGGMDGPNSNRPYNFTLKGKRFPSRAYHTHKVVPRSRPNAQEQLGRRRWRPSRRHGRVIRREDYDAYAAREHGQTTQFLNSESLLDLSIRGRRTVKGSIGGAPSGRGLCAGWPCSWKSKLGKVTKVFRRG